MPSLVGSEMCIRDRVGNDVIYVGWVGVGWQRCRKTRQSLRGLVNQSSTVSFCFVLLDYFFTLTPYKGNDRITQCDSVHMVRQPCGRCIVYPLLCLEVATPENKSTHFGRGHPYTRKSASHAVLSRMQLTLHATRPTPHGASRLVQAMSAWSVKTRRAPVPAL